jgi:hypothetical protein
MAYPSVLYGPDSLAYETYAAEAPAPGAGFNGCQVSQRGRFPLGTKLVLQDGRAFRFGLNGGVAAVVGDVHQTPVVITTDVDLAPAAGAVNDRFVSITHGSATTAINYLAEGTAVMSLAPGGGHTYKIAAHAALTSGGAGEMIWFAPGHAIREAITTTTDVDLLPQLYASTIQCAATITGGPVGVCVSATAANRYHWLATQGLCGTLSSASLTIGSPAVMLLSGGTAGSVAPAAAATNPLVGTVIRIAAATEFSSIFLKLE